MSLKAELDTFRADFIAKLPRKIRRAMRRADMELAGSGVLERALRAGDSVPDFQLSDLRGSCIRLNNLLANGPVVLSFYRGEWCQYCNLELQALQKVLPQIIRHGAELVAISPQTPDHSLSTAEKNGVTFPLLSDLGSVTATAFGISFEVAEDLRPIYARFGHALPDKNGDGSWSLTIPATYVIDHDGIIALAFLDIDYRNRLEPTDVLTVLRALKKLQV